ncbi:Uma2 family endonuclease [Runella slithyformis]|uniref:Putative restriction endonuclease domain-containing protein n=1 Tax=Runella slithyformis (strain ATCC 29530 / DSM 19594 / LMG 11500 / NCIMB 11436 / LSU 4) TaxID=761193 RepID=A0A7U3ZKJ5_RUNSL|nr:Uma2 family endonuclease [Runella slithyformis]AEI48915.1 protein of unknown function DUF820 [Runella slithyformis DSM 19594]
MGTVVEKLYSVDEYFTLEDKSEVRHEFYYGELIEMPGETTTANLIALNIAFFFKALFRQLKGYAFFAHYVKLMVMNNRVYRYPDLVVIHQKGDQKKYVTDPVLIVEVLSESTENIDRDKKRLEYFGLASLQYYLTIHQDEPIVEIYSRSGKSWQFDFYTSLEDVVRLPFFETEIILSEIFEGVSFEKKGE